MKRGIVVAVVVVVLTIVGAYVGSPWYAARQLQAAAHAGDTAALTARIDFPALRDNLKGQLAAKLMAEAAKENGGEAVTAAGSAFAMALMGPIIDAMITPQSVALMLDGIKPLAQRLPAGERPAATVTTTAYRGLNRFEIAVAARTDPMARFTFTLQRQGWFGWKVEAITLPD